MELNQRNHPSEGQGRLPFQRPGHVGGGNRESNPAAASLATIPRTMCIRELVRVAGIAPVASWFRARSSTADLHPGIGSSPAERSQIFRLSAGCTDFCASELKWSGWKDSNLHGHAPKARGQPLTHILKLDMPTGFAPAWQRFAGVRLAIQPRHELGWQTGLAPATGDSQSPGYLLRLQPPVTGTTGGHRTHNHAG